MQSSSIKLTEIPVIFNIILLIDVYVDPNYFENIANFLWVEYYVTLIGVVFATGK